MFLDVLGRGTEISIHALREEGDHGIYYGLSIPDLFLSTPSARRATRTAVGYRLKSIISIHALREEGDVHSGGYCHTGKQFLSTPSARRATP